MFNLKELKQHPDKKKKQIAFVASSAIMAIVVVVWVTTLPARLGQTAAVGNVGALQPIADDLNTGTRNVNSSGSQDNIPVKEYTSNDVVITDSTPTLGESAR